MNVFDEAYKRAKDFFECIADEAVTPLCEFAWDFLKSFAALLFAILIYGTLPIWIIPYKIAKKRKKKKPEENTIYKQWITSSDCNCRCSIHPITFKETLSSETKQTILNDFMKGVR